MIWDTRPVASSTPLSYGLSFLPAHREGSNGAAYSPVTSASLSIVGRMPLFLTALVLLLEYFMPLRRGERFVGDDFYPEVTPNHAKTSYDTT